MSSSDKQNKIFVFDRIPQPSELKEDEPAYVQTKDGTFFHCIKHNGIINVLKMESVNMSHRDSYYQALAGSKYFSESINFLGGPWYPSCNGGVGSLTSGTYLRFGNYVVAFFYLKLAAGAATDFVIYDFPHNVGLITSDGTAPQSGGSLIKNPSAFEMGVDLTNVLTIGSATNGTAKLPVHGGTPFAQASALSGVYTGYVIYKI
jgi:hypothetical protein